ncbi:MAG: Spy/CpxP family protein refolding chaperone, partial [Candidatus Omnitrophota bacterium]
ENCMKNIKQIVLKVFLISCFTLSFVYAEQVTVDKPVLPKTGQEHMQKRIQKIFAQLNLSDTQKTQIEANKQKQKEQMKFIFEQMKTKKEEMRQELMKPNLDINRINGIQSQLKVVHSQMMDQRLNSILEVRKILTPEQFNKFISIMEEHKSKGHGPDEGGSEGDRPLKNEEFK